MMADLEKVIKGLEETEILLTQAVDRGGEMAVMGAFKCLNRITDTIALLKEQEAVEPINSYGTLRCGKCGNIVGYNDGYGRGYQNNFCSECGKAVKWE